MRKLDLNRASSKMSPDVHFVLAIPLTEPEKEFTCPSPVSGVLFVDSMDSNFFVDGDLLEGLVSAIHSFLLGLEDKPAHVAGGIFNMTFARLCKEAPPLRKIPPEVTNALELVTSVDPPQASRAFQFNFGYSDFIPVKSGWAAEEE
jgi:hypothetical protein